MIVIAVEIVIVVEIEIVIDSGRLIFDLSMICKL